MSKWKQAEGVAPNMIRTLEKAENSWQRKRGWQMLAYQFNIRKDIELKEGDRQCQDGIRFGTIRAIVGLVLRQRHFLKKLSVLNGRPGGTLHSIKKTPYHSLVLAPSTTVSGIPYRSK